MGTNPFLTDMFKVVNSSDGNLMVLCDKTGDIKASNISFSNSAFVSMWPSGNYKTAFRVFDDIDSNIFYLTYYLTAQNDKV